MSEILFGRFTFIDDMQADIDLNSKFIHICIDLIFRSLNTNLYNYINKKRLY